MAKKARCRGKGEGSLVLRGHTWFARWTVTVDGVKKHFTRTTGESDKRKAEKKLAEFTAPFRLDTEVEILEAVTVKLDGRKAEVQAYEDSLPAMTLMQAWAAFKVKPKGKTIRGRTIMPGERTLADYEGRWESFCDWMEKNYPKKDEIGNRIPWELRKIGKEHAEKYIAEIGASRSANTRNKTVTLLRLIFKVLAEDARIKENPFDGMEAPRPAMTRKRALTLEELNTISKQLEGKGEMELLFSLGFYTGARLGDCVSIRWGNIDMGGMKIHYTPHKTAKSNTEIKVAIKPALFALLDQTPKDKRKGLVLPELGTLYQTRSGVAAVSKRIQKVFEDAGIETALKVEGYSRSVARVGFHSLRHAYITALLDGGVSMDVVRQQAGHASLDMTAHYFHASANTLKAVSDATPDFGTPNGRPEATDAAQAQFDAFLMILDSLTDEQLATLKGKVGRVLKKRSSTGQKHAKKKLTAATDKAVTA